MSSTAESLRVFERPAGRAIFRFFPLYFALYFFPFPFAALFVSPEGIDGYANAWTPIVNAVRPLFGIHTSLHYAGAMGDTLADYVQSFVLAILAALGTALWTASDRGKPNARAHDLLRVCLRYALASMMLAYGFAKVFPSQMPLPEPSLLLTPYGRSVPMTILWAFMGTSPAYEVYAGLAEVLGALLLLSRKTTTIGALVTAAVMSNVVMVNLCFDVYVKQCAIHLFLLAVFLALPGVPRVFDALVLGRGVAAVPSDTSVVSRWPRAGLAMKAIAILAILRAQASTPAHHYFDDSDGAPLPALYGIYDIHEMRRNDAIVPPLLTDGTYWHHLFFGRRSAGVVFADGSRGLLEIARGAAADTWIAKRSDGAVVTIARVDASTLAIEGIVDGAKIVVLAHPAEAASRRLLERRLHWVANF